MKPQQAVVRSSVLAPIAAATTARTAAIDCQGADYATIVFHIGAELNTNSTNVALNLKESDTNAATAYVTFDSAFAVTADNTNATVQVFNVDLKANRKRYLQVNVTPDTTTNGAVISSVTVGLVKEVQGANSANADQVVVG
jgi:hypothetical protein